MNAIVKELRDRSFNVRTPSWALRAADEIERLELVLVQIASLEEGDVVTSCFDEPHAARKARAALQENRA